MPAPSVVDSVVASGAGPTVTTGSLTVSGSNRILYVFVGNSDNNPVAVSGIKWGGSGGTPLSRLLDTGIVESFVRGEMWRLIAPTAQSSTVEVTLASGTTACVVVAVAIQDADQSTPNGTVVSAHGNGGGAAPTVNPASAVGELVLDGIYRLANTVSVGAGQTQLEQAFFTEGSGASSTEAGAAGTVAMTWSADTGTGTASNLEWAQIGLSIKPVSAPAGTTMTDTLTLSDQAQSSLLRFIPPGPPSVIAKIVRRVGVLN